METHFMAQPMISREISWTARNKSNNGTVDLPPETFRAIPDEHCQNNGCRHGLCQIGFNVITWNTVDHPVGWVKVHIDVQRPFRN
jgi:hypothetical protein